jgi:hypothetical protein
LPSTAAPPPPPDAPINYYAVAPGTESVFRVREPLNASPDNREFLALSDGFAEVAENKTSTIVRTFARASAKPTQLFKLPAPLSYSDMQVDPAGQQIAVVIGDEPDDSGNLYVWSKQAGLRRLIVNTKHRAPQKGFLRWSFDGKWLGLAVVERPCGKVEECVRGLVADAATGAVKYLTPPQIQTGQVTFNADRGFLCGSLNTTLDDELDNEIGLRGIGQARPERTPDEKRDGCRWHELPLATGRITRGHPPDFTSPDGQFLVRIEHNELAVTPSSGASPYRISIAEPTTPLVWLAPHILELQGFAFDLATKLSRSLAPSGLRFLLLSLDRQTALFEAPTTGSSRGEILLADRR